MLIQHPGGGRVDKLYWPVPASDIMKMNPGHYVALLLTTTTFNPGAAAGATNDNKNNIPVRITRIKLLKPTDTLLLGHVYRLITTQEVMKGLWAKKNGKMKQQAEPIEKQQKMRPKPTSDSKTGLIARSENKEHCNQIKHRSGGNSSAAGAVKCKAWQPSLNSISEAAS
nr:uncharacterized protein LOC109191125 [Ipomoea batatas]GMC86201.1 uncharacterized protein LOC109191125 [Ipomoea batatas]